ncbi:MAG: peptide chain release factor N(5)-glutamine methyltransferase [Wenzhouxiangellaceae bacterium]|nr:peptide chain release factor N(5)-glutamine methyltransferase [Wenzhouxiangellaceae bacterium]
MTVRQILAAASDTLGSRADAEILATIVLGRSRAWLYAHDDQAVGLAERRAFEPLLEQRAAGRPLAYIAGFREFYGRNFSVDEAVLIPRPETEHLVDFALSLEELPDAARVADIGTGSGCIALTLAAERPAWHCIGVDCSAEALAVAARNAEQLDLKSIEWLDGHLLDPINDRSLDLIVSNPPYIAESDAHLERGDLRFEPDLALSAGPDGMSVISELIERSPRLLANGGWLVLEHGYDQAAHVRQLMRERGFEKIRSESDLAGIERITGAYWKA